ncbi:hypothetical protein [Pedococcus bigeumensis]|uniref:Uncharacterized protein n=1 Tax=Pedococcus bigeumensis TaxID=433644 RepID=A0A502CHV3_9MICO|nr:hypothetical protein [Pedococcus bigeumensis]TPG12558.1 hypothetical protein EAH86_19835 [Pedococcus bigeumensis]
MNTDPIQLLGADDLGPTGYFGPDSGIKPTEPRNGAQDRVKAVKVTDIPQRDAEPATVVSGLTLMASPPISLGCARQPCGGSLENVDPRHVDNLKGVWVCDEHRGGDAA